MKTSKKIISEDLFLKNDGNDELLKIIYDKKRKFFLNFSLVFIYIILIISSIFII